MTRRRNPSWYQPFFCSGCDRQHGADVLRTEYKRQLYCERTYYHAAGFGPYRTPKTTLVWSCLADWLTCANQLEKRRLSQRRNDAIKQHVLALPVAVIERCNSVLALGDLVAYLNVEAFERPTRGRREVVNETPLIETAKNRIAYIERQSDLPMLGPDIFKNRI